jgi:hypothetical protein
MSTKYKSIIALHGRNKVITDGANFKADWTVTASSKAHVYEKTLLEILETCKTDNSTIENYIDKQLKSAHKP